MENIAAEVDKAKATQPVIYLFKKKQNEPETRMKIDL